MVEKTGKIVVFCFFDEMPKLRAALEMFWGHHLGWETIIAPRCGSSLSKGETMDDTLKALWHMGHDLIVYVDFCDDNRIKFIARQEKFKLGFA